MKKLESAAKFRAGGSGCASQMDFAAPGKQAKPATGRQPVKPIG
jgi:hypothetical protein